VPPVFPIRLSLIKQVGELHRLLCVASFAAEKKEGREGKEEEACRKEGQREATCAPATGCHGCLLPHCLPSALLCT